MLDRLFIYGAIVIATHGAAYLKGRVDEQQAAAAAIAEAREHQYKVIQKETVRYVEKIKLVNRDVPTVAGRIERLCSDSGMRGTGVPAKADAGTQADARADLGREIIQAVDAVDQCESLISYIHEVKKKGL